MLTTTYLRGKQATFTVEPSLEAIRAGFAPHYTYRVETGRRDDNRHIHYLMLFVGSDNSKRSSYRYLAKMCPKTGALTFTAGSCRAKSDRVARVAARVLSAIFAGKGDEITNAAWTVHHEGRCCNCGKALTVPASVETGIGPECEKFVRLGIAREDVPCRDPRGAWVAFWQLSYWIAGGDYALTQLAASCRVAFGWGDDRVELYVACTRALMRRHKKGKALNAAFIAHAKAVVASGEVDWRPLETVPEDYYALSV